MNKTVRISATILTVTLMVSCYTRGYLASPPPKIMAKQDKRMINAIKTYGRTGDWILVRGYLKSSDFIADVTGGVFSHAAILDRELNQVIESDHTGVHATSLNVFTEESHRMVIVRPKWRVNRKAGKMAVEQARKLIGKPYNFTGLIGIPTPNSYYCSELVTHAYKAFIHKSEKLPKVITPLELLNWGRIVYDTGVRTLPSDSVMNADNDD